MVESKPMTKAQQLSFKISQSGKPKGMPELPPLPPVPQVDIESVRQFDKQLMLELAEDTDSWIAYDWEGDEAVAINIKSTVDMLKQVISQKFEENTYPASAKKAVKKPKTTTPPVEEEELEEFDENAEY